MSRIRSCHFMLILYDDDPSHIFGMEHLKRGGYQYVGILHNLDRHENGELKKPHHHVIVSFPRQKDLSALANELGIASNYIEPVRNKEASYRYLLHASVSVAEASVEATGDSFEGSVSPAGLGKYVYDPSSLYGPLAPIAQACALAGSTEEDKVKSLLALLDTMPVPCTYRRFLVAACDANLYSVFRRLGHVLEKLMDEHNGWGIQERNVPF